MAIKKSGINTLSYLGVESPTPPQFVRYDRTPTTNDYKNFQIGTIWLNTAANNPPVASDVWILVAKYNPATNNQEGVWRQMIGSTGDVDFLTGDTGGNVGPDAGDSINVVSGIANLSFDGNPGTFTVTLNSSGGGGLLETLTGDNGGAVGPDANGDITVTAADGAINSGTTVHFDGNPGANKIVLDLSDTVLNNVLLATNSGNATLTGTGNSALGINTLNALTTGSDNTVVGYLALELLTSGDNNAVVGRDAMTVATTASDNVAGGYTSLAALTTGSNNTSLGSESGDNLVSGTDNVLIGYQAGTSYTTNESNNILIANDGTIADSATIRIGENGTHTSAFLAGVSGVALGTPLPVFVDAVTDQLGTATLSQGVVVADATGAISSINGTDGQIIVAATGSDPLFASLTSTDGTITVTPGANTLDLSASFASLDFDTDGATATPAADTIIIAGGTNVTTSGAGNTVTINASVGNIDFATDAGTATPAANTITMTGGANITTSGAAAVVTFDVDFGGLDFDTDSGTANPAGGAISIQGGTGITTSGAADTITITATATNLTYVAIDNTDSPYDASDDEYISVDCSAAVVTVRLPDAAALESTFTVKDRTGNASNFNITVTTVSGATNIDGATTFVMNTDFEAINIIGNGSTYEVF